MAVVRKLERQSTEVKTRHTETSGTYAIVVEND